MCEVLSQMDGSAYVVRRSLHDVANIRKAKKALRTAFEVQRQGLGFSMVELLSTCPTNWGITAGGGADWIEEHMIPAFPLGDYKVHRPPRHWIRPSSSPVRNRSWKPQRQAWAGAWRWVLPTAQRDPLSRGSMMSRKASPKRLPGQAGWPSPRETLGGGRA